MSDPKLKQGWRDIILHGRNVATYKFALGRALLELAAEGRGFVTLEELAVPYQRHMVRHVREVPRQMTSRSSRYVAACFHYVEGRINETELQSATLIHGFNHVIDAFHNVETPHADPTQFYIDERKGKRSGGIRLTDEILQLANSEVTSEITQEVETRWQLVERAWETRYGSGQPLLMAYEEPSESLIPALLGKRTPFRASVRPSLNGYQRGHCFYCYCPISYLPEGLDGSHVDHFVPFASAARGLHDQPIDGVWNLVLACKDCNQKKHDSLPARSYMQQLATRNEWLIESNHPLKETVIKATGPTQKHRAKFLQRVYARAAEVTRGPWKAEQRAPFPFTQFIIS
ncbi:HNH endonuclease [Halorhodospira sp. 9622]|uniref:HNH endonuclease n=1 Tax=Halorhodospira sp. 9622 TaxID=2899136 RepID=UPI001EE86DCC|nr:HNH endonuclease [Halorhodospira sp. 9622]MCG5537849.1 HNH endonuclease [Halorhodospira sp. 9622]